VNDITTVAPIFDLVKLSDVSKNVISKMSALEVYENTLAWAEEYDQDFAAYLKNNKDYAIRVLNIDRETPKPRKDIYKWSMVKSYFDYMFDSPKTNELAEEDRNNYVEFISEYSKNYTLENTKEDWFANIKVVAEKLGYATDNKLYKANPETYKGNTAKACEFVRLALTGRKNSPDLYEIMQILGTEEIKRRFELVK
jgi:glutamyl-tRNA synthetase